jgi:hypothetical protein
MNEDKNPGRQNRSERQDRQERNDRNQNRDIDNVEFGTDFFDDISYPKNENKNRDDNFNKNNNCTK